MDPRWISSACVAGVLTLAPYAIACARDREAESLLVEAVEDDPTED